MRNPCRGDPRSARIRMACVASAPAGMLITYSLLSAKRDYFSLAHISTFNKNYELFCKIYSGNMLIYAKKIINLRILNFKSLIFIDLT
jgi:hypothetical protein